MREWLLIIVAILVAAYAAHLEYERVPALEGKIEEEAVRADSLTEKNQKLKGTIAELELKLSEKELAPKEPAMKVVVEKEVLKKEAVVEAEPVKRDQTRHIQAEVARLTQVKSNNERSYELKKNELESEINRGKKAHRDLSAKQPDFKEWEGNNRGIRTSDATRELWHKDKQHRLNIMTNAINKLESERAKLTLEYTTAQRQIDDKIKGLQKRL